MTIFKRRPLNVWIVMGWDETPRGVFASEASARRFAESQPDYETRDFEIDGTGPDCYPFISKYEVQA